LAVWQGYQGPGQLRTCMVQVHILTLLEDYCYLVIVPAE
jgi:hypothetical protein